MAIKKSELYSSLWASCDALRGGMEPSQYKDYVLMMLFIKYISDKWAGQPYAPVKIPDGASFQDMVALKGKTDIGDQINKKIISPIKEANRISKAPDFNDVSMLGSGKEMVDRLTNLIAIFEDPKLDFSKNRAEGDDILGDGYEYLMRHFASESGKSKGQFYTPSEVSRILAKIIGINNENTTAETTVYDPTCGSGSLLLKVAAEANNKVTLYGQEKESSNASMAWMNMILHNNPTAEIKQGNTLVKTYEENGNMQIFDYVVANPPFSDKNWSTGLTLPDDPPYNRFNDFGVPPAKNGDFAFMLHIVRSLKRNGKGAVILPHGVLFRGNAEAVIRQNLVRKGYIKGIIGLPGNLFYGTGIPASIILIDKENSVNRKGIFIIDAGKGFMKDGNKNRLREQDIHKIADVMNKQIEIPGYSRMVSIAEIEENEYNLNIPRYIDSQEKEDIQDIEAHLKGGIPKADIEALEDYWKVFPNINKELFEPTDRENYAKLKVVKDNVKETIFEHPEFANFQDDMNGVFRKWETKYSDFLKGISIGDNPQSIIHRISEEMLNLYAGMPLVDKYDIYQHLMTYWNDIMQDDCYIISADGWKAETYRIIEKNKDKGWACDLVPKELVIHRYFLAEKQAIEELESTSESLASELSELEEEHSGEEGHFSELEKVNKANITKRLKTVKTELKSSDDEELVNEKDVLEKYLVLNAQQSTTNKQIKTAQKDLDNKLYAKYPELSEEEIRILVVDDKWLTTIKTSITGEIDHISQHLTNRIKELADRYESPLPEIDKVVKDLEVKVNAHLEKDGILMVNKNTKKMMVQGCEISVIATKSEDFISLTDMVRDIENGLVLIEKWLRNKNTIEFLGIWEEIYNPDFNSPEFEGIKKSGWFKSIYSFGKAMDKKTNAVGIFAKAGRYGGTYAHKDIAFEFASWISPKFKIYLIKEFQRLKNEEQKQLGWDIKRNLTKINYRIHTDAIRDNLIPKNLDKSQINTLYASEADILNMAIFGMTAKQWRDKNLSKKGNIRDFANVSQLVCLANLENLNALFINEKLSQSQRLTKLNQIAIQQMKILLKDPSIRKLKETNN